MTHVSGPPSSDAAPIVFEVPGPSNPPPPRPQAPPVSLKTPASIIVRKDQRHKTGGKKV